ATGASFAVAQAEATRATARMSLLFTMAPAFRWGKSFSARDAFAPRIGAAFPAGGRAAYALEAARHVDRMHVVAHRLQSGGYAFQFRALLDFRRAVAAPEIREAHRRLHVEVPVERRDERLHD